MWILVERWLVLLAVGILLIVFGLAIPYASLTREVNASYTVDIQAPSGLRWVLWLPMPLSPMDVQSADSGVSVQVVDSGRGLFLNVTGAGAASLSGSSHRFVFDLDPLEWKGERVDLSGGGTGGGFWVFRATGDPSATIEVTGRAHWSASYLGGSIACGGPAFQGHPSEGWTLLGPMLGDCVQLVDSVPWPAVGAILGTSGAAGIALAAVVRRRSRPRQGQQVFLPPPA